MKKLLISTILVLTSTFGVTAQAAPVNVVTISNFTQGDIFSASGLPNTVSVGLINGPGSTASLGAVNAANTTGTFLHNYIFSPITSLVIAISAGSSNTGSGGIADLVMTVANVTAATSQSVAVPVGGSSTLPLTMTAGNVYQITMENTGNTNVSGQYLLSVSNVPIPAAFLLFGSALLGLFGLKGKRGKSGELAAA